VIGTTGSHPALDAAPSAEAPPADAQILGVAGR
jgi:hypothetical protein